MAGSSSRPWHISLQAWIGLLLLGLTFVFMVAHGRLLLHVGSVLFGAVLLSLAIRPLADKLAERRVPGIPQNCRE